MAVPVTTTPMHDREYAHTAGGASRRFSSATAVLRKPSRPDPRFVYPPYGRLAEKIMRKVL